jgi:hypothetical protein
MNHQPVNKRREEKDEEEAKKLQTHNVVYIKNDIRNLRGETIKKKFCRGVKIKMSESE